MIYDGKGTWLNFPIIEAGVVCFWGGSGALSPVGETGADTEVSGGVEEDGDEEFFDFSVFAISRNLGQLDHINWWFEAE